MSDEKPKRKGGRPAKSAEGKATRNLTFRTRDSLREKLSEAAAASHRSISEEIEHRLQRSFNRDELSQHIDGLLSDSLVKGEEVERANREADELRDALKRVTEQMAELEKLLREERDSRVLSHGALLNLEVAPFEPELRAVAPKKRRTEETR